MTIRYLKLLINIIIIPVVGAMVSAHIILNVGVKILRGIKMKKILITGSRGFNDAELMKQIIRDNVSLLEDTIIHGGASGVDAVAQSVCDFYDINQVVVRPVDRASKISYLFRNSEMVGMADKVIAIWDGSSKGTKFTIDYARSRDKLLKTYRFKHDNNL